MDLFTDVYSFPWQANKLNFYILARMLIVLHGSASQGPEQETGGKGGSGGVDEAVPSAREGRKQLRSYHVGRRKSLK